MSLEAQENKREHRNRTKTVLHKIKQTTRQARQKRKILLDRPGNKINYDVLPYTERTKEQKKRERKKNKQRTKNKNERTKKSAATRYN